MGLDNLVTLIMAGYEKPKLRLHKEFLYLNYDTIFNSLSALEAGKVDEIIQKYSEVRDSGIEGGAGIGSTKIGAGKKKTANFEEELRRTRTNFSAFEEWHKYLSEAQAFGKLNDWNLETREELGVGDTLNFLANISISPLQQIFMTFISFAKQASDPKSPLKQTGAELASTKSTAQMMNDWIQPRENSKTYITYMDPFGIKIPRVLGRLDDKYLVRGAERIEGEYTVIGQVETLVTGSASIPAIRIFKESPPTPLEISTTTSALKEFASNASTQGVLIGDADISFDYPTVIIHPIAIYR